MQDKFVHSYDKDSPENMYYTYVTILGKWTKELRINCNSQSASYEYCHPNCVDYTAGKKVIDMTQALRYIPTIEKRHAKTISTISPLAGGNCWEIVTFDITRFLAYTSISRDISALVEFWLLCYLQIRRKSIDVCYYFCFNASVSKSWYRALSSQWSVCKLMYNHKCCLANVP